MKLISYASVERIEGKDVVLEMEMHTTTESVLLTPHEKVTIQVYVEKEILLSALGSFGEGDIIVVEHNGNHLEKVCRKDAL